MTRQEDIDGNAALGRFIQAMMFGGVAGGSGPPFRHVHVLPSTEEEMAAEPGPRYTMSRIDELTEEK